MSTLVERIRGALEEWERVARDCAEMFPPPWEIADRGWRVRIYASGVPIEDLMSDEPDASAIRNPVVMEVEPGMHIEDPKWLTERVEHVRLNDPAHVLRMVGGLRTVVGLHQPYPELQRMVYGTITACEMCGSVDDAPVEWPCPTLLAVADALGVEVSK